MATALRARPPGRYLRYEFDNAAQLRRHCRLVDGRVLLFFPHDDPICSPRSRALIELCMANSAQQVALPALVHSRTNRGHPGCWLELRALSAVAGLQSATGAPRRRQRRLAFDQLAWVTHDNGPVMACPVLDVSRGGAHLWGVPGEAPSPGERIRLRMQHSPTLSARIAWAHGREVGVEFAPESLGSAREIYQRIEALWAAARVARHDPSCTCTTGADPLDPPAPARALEGGAAR